MIVLKCVSAGREEQKQEGPHHRDDREQQRDHRRHERPEQHHQDHERREQPDEVADALGRRRILGLAGELDLDPGGLADRAELILDATMPERGNSKPVRSYCTSKKAICPLSDELLRPSCGQRARDRCDVLRVGRQRALRGMRRDEHLRERVRALGRVEPLTVGRREHDAQRSALLAAELRVDQVGRLLRVRARDLEVVDQLAVERRVEPDQQRRTPTPS